MSNEERLLQDQSKSFLDTFVLGKRDRLSTSNSSKLMDMRYHNGQGMVVRGLT